jgi:hypothetical protein
MKKQTEMDAIEKDVAKRHAGYDKQYEKVDSAMQEYTDRIAKAQKEKGTNPQRPRAKGSR